MKRYNLIHPRLNPKFSIQQLVGYAWASNLSVQQITRELRQLGHKVSPKYVKNQYRKHDAEWEGFTSMSDLLSEFR